MEKASRFNNVTNADIEITNPYAKGCDIQQVSFKLSTSADGWKYHKKNKLDILPPLKRVGFLDASV